MRPHSIVDSILLACIASCFAFARIARVLLYQDVSLPTEKRVDDLVSRITLEEKISQMTNDSAAIPRLNIPAYNWWNEGLHGVARSGYKTLFPQAIGMVATWDAELIGRESDVISTEARAKYNEATRHGIHSINYGFTLRTIFGNTYLPAFRATITEAKADSIMCAYNAIDKSPACANQQLLNTIPGERLSHIL